MTQTLQSPAASQLDTDYLLSDEQIAQYRRDGFIQLNDVITGDDLQALRDAVNEAVLAEKGNDKRDVASKGTYEQIFIQVVNLWQRHPKVKPFVLSKRFGNL